MENCGKLFVCKFLFPSLLFKHQKTPSLMQVWSKLRVLLVQRKSVIQNIIIQNKFVYYIHSGQFNPFTIFRTRIGEMFLLGERDKTQTIPDPGIIVHAHCIHCENLCCSLKKSREIHRTVRPTLAFIIHRTAKHMLCHAIGYQL